MLEPPIEDYTIGWICALQEEYEAACRMLDGEFDGPEASEANDNNTYVFGLIGGHNVVIGCLPNGLYGTSSAASVARDMVRSFPNLRFALMVGIGGGAPTRERDIRLGDVVVSAPHGGFGGVVQYDFGKRLPNGRFQRTGQLNSPPGVLLGVIPEMRRRHDDPRKPDRVAEHLKLMDDMPGYQHPTQDRLYRADYEHKSGKNCENCEVDGLKERPRRGTSREVTVHYGIIASANSVMKNATERDQYANDPELGVLCFEMEAGGLMNNFPCLVIRGICDYSDSHKNDDWHKYAALTAATYARELLIVLKPKKVAVMPSWAGKMENRKWKGFLIVYSPCYVRLPRRTRGRLPFLKQGLYLSLVSRNASMTRTKPGLMPEVCDTLYVCLAALLCLTRLTI
jgi:nucleoside phosphorylase